MPVLSTISEFVKCDISPQVITFCDRYGAPFTLLSTDFSDQLRVCGDTLKVPVLEDFVIEQKQKTDKNEYEADIKEVGGCTIELTDDSYVGCCFTAKQLQLLQRMGRTKEEIGRIIANKFWTSVYEKFFENLLEAAPLAEENTWYNDSGEVFDGQAILALDRKKRKKSGWGADCDVLALLGCDLFGGLLADKCITNHPSLEGLAGQALINAQLNRLYSLDIANYDYVPDLGVGIGGVMLAPSTVGMAFAATAVAGSPGEGCLVDLDYMQIPGTGMGVTYREMYDAKRDVREYYWEVLWGMKVFKPDCVRWLVDTDLVDEKG